MGDGNKINDMMKKITESVNLQKINLSEMIKPVGPERFLPSSVDIDALNAGIRREHEEKAQREKETVELLRQILEMAKESPALQQHIQTLIQNSGTIHNMQTVHSGATGIQNITNNTGIQAEEMLKLINTMREISDLLVPERAEEAKDLIDELEQEVQKPEPEAKKGRIKASLAYLMSLFKDVIVDPSKSIAKAQFTAYAQEKAPEIIQGIEHIFNSSSQS